MLKSDVKKALVSPKDAVIWRSWTHGWRKSLQALTHWCGVCSIEQIQEVPDQEGGEATVDCPCLTVTLGVKQGGRDIPTA